jgi:hypothetical protein
MKEIYRSFTAGFIAVLVLAFMPLGLVVGGGAVVMVVMWVKEIIRRGGAKSKT